MSAQHFSPEILRQLDAEVARRVMGYQHVDTYRYVRQKFGRLVKHEGTYETWRARWMDEHKHQWPVEDVVEEFGLTELMYWGAGEACRVPYFSSDAGHASEAIDHARLHGLYISSAPIPGPGLLWEIRGRDARGELLAEATGPDQPFLVCAVALAAAGRLGELYAHSNFCR